MKNILIVNGVFFIKTGLGGVVGYHVSLTSHVGHTEGPEFKPRLSHNKPELERASFLFVFVLLMIFFLPRFFF